MHIDLELQFLLRNFNYIIKNYIIVGSFGMSSAIEWGFPRGGGFKETFWLYYE